MDEQNRIPSFRHLRVFDAIARTRSVTHGAASVHLSQSAATQVIFNLETWAATTLLHRDKTGVHPTDEGALVLKAVQDLLAKVETALEGLQDEPSPEKVRLASARLKSSHLRMLRALSEFTSLDIAAHALGLTRNSAQRIARDLEAAVGARLFERTPRGASATAQTMAFARAFDSGWADVEAALAKVATRRRKPAARLHIGVQSLSSTYLLAAAVNDLLAREPDTDVRIIQGSAHHLLECIQTGRIDIMFGAVQRTAVAADGLREIPLLHNPYCVAARAGHPLASKTQVTLDDLCTLDWVIPGRGAQRREAFETLFRHASRRPTAQIDTMSIAFQVGLLRMSDRVALLTPLEMALDPHMQGLKALAYDTGLTRSPDGVALRAGRAPTPVQSAFLACLKRRIDEFAPYPIAIAEEDRRHFELAPEGLCEPLL